MCDAEGSRKYGLYRRQSAVEDRSILVWYLCSTSLAASDLKYLFIGKSEHIYLYRVSTIVKLLLYSTAVS